ncbi:MAG TPA: hypothetical protein VHN14_13245 [Kofleriaceae bacterium]|jgi:hypothetical protein|nr:hypothetical protein [Kofleriaceae bacterium]
MRIGWKTSATVVAAFALGAIGGVTVAKTAKPEYSLVPAGTAKFGPIDPKNASGPQASPLSGDLKTGPVAFFLKLPKGGVPPHWHSSDYYAVSVEGTTKHWLVGKEADAKPNPPGTFWFQPGGNAATTHGDECISDSCTVFIFMPGKLDFTMADAKAAPAKK